MSIIEVIILSCVIIVVILIVIIFITRYRKAKLKPDEKYLRLRREDILIEIEESKRRGYKIDDLVVELDDLVVQLDELGGKGDKIYHRVRYWKKMQKGKEYPFIVFITKMKNLLNTMNQTIKKDEILTEIGRSNLPQKDIKGFYVHVSSPAMEIYPASKKVFLDKDERNSILHKIEFKVVPNYCSKFDIKLEFVYDDITFYEESFKTKIQKSGFKIKKLQISSSVISFFSLFITLGTFIQPFLPFDIVNFLFYYGMVVLIAFLGFLFYNISIGNRLIQIVNIEFSPTISRKIEF